MFVLDTLRDADSALATLVGAVDETLLSPAEVSEALCVATHISNRASTLMAKLAVRLESTDSWKDEGARSSAHDLARRTGTSVTRARQVLDTGRRLSHHGVADEAACSGELSFDQVALICEGSEVNPAAESHLVEMATTSSLRELCDATAVAKAQVIDLETQRRRVHKDRFVRTWCDGDGGWNLSCRNTVEAGAQVMAALESLTNPIFLAARSEGRREHPRAYMADALVEMARRVSCTASSNPAASDTAGSDTAASDIATSNKSAEPSRSTGVSSPTANTPGRPRSYSNAKIIVRVDLSALLRGHRGPDETCEIAGFGPVAVSAVTDMIDTGDPFLAAVATKGEKLVGVAHLGRRPRSVQMTALEWLNPTCSARGCGATSRLEVDHRVDWARSHVTVVDLLDRLCPFHHDLKTTKNWALVPGRSKRAFVPPDDPRHPDYENRAGPAETSSTSASTSARSGQHARAPAQAA